MKALKWPDTGDARKVWNIIRQPFDGPRWCEDVPNRPNRDEYTLLNIGGQYGIGCCDGQAGEDGWTDISDHLACCLIMEACAQWLDEHAKAWRIKIYSNGDVVGIAPLLPADMYVDSRLEALIALVLAVHKGE